MGAQIQTETGQRFGPRPTPAGDKFSASRLTASLLGLPSFDSLSPAQIESFQKQMGHGLWAELKSLTKERDAELFYSGILHLGRGLQNQDKTEWAHRLYSLVAGQSEFTDLAQRAKTSIAALEGHGEIGARAEVLLSRFSKEFRDPVMIAPMMVGTSVGSLARGFGLGRLAAGPAAWYSRGLGASVSAGSLGFAAEVPAFVLSGRALRTMSSAPQATWGQDFSTGALSLGAIKLFGFAGKQGLAQAHGVNEWGAMTRGLALARYSHPFVNQASLFGGLMSAHYAETKLGLRPQVDDATAVTDTLAAMISLGAGARLGRGLLGESYARSMHELEWRTQSLQKAMPLPAFALPRLNAASSAAATGLGVLLQSPLAHASDGRWNPTTLTATILSVLTVGGLMAYGGYRIYRSNVAPAGPIRRLDRLQGDVPTMLPTKLAKETAWAEKLLKESAAGGRRGDTATAEAALRFMERAVERLDPRERFPIFSSWIDLILEGKENFTPPTWAALKSTSRLLSPGGREKLLDKVHMGTRSIRGDKAVTAFYLLGALAEELDVQKRAEVYEKAIKALEFQRDRRDDNIDNNAKLLTKQRALLIEFRDFLDQQQQEIREKLVNELYELKKDPEGGLLPGRKARIEVLEEKVKNPPEPPIEESLQKFLKESEDARIHRFDLEDALVQGHKLLELFDESNAYRLPNFETDFSLRTYLHEPAMKAYLRNGNSYIDKVSSTGIQEMLANHLLASRTTDPQGEN